MTDDPVDRQQQEIVLLAEFVQEFTSFKQWVNKANRVGRYGAQQQIICLDKNGGYVHQGSDFMYTDENDLFPVKCYRLIRNTEKLNP
jgi:hypothetical protein